MRAPKGMLDVLAPDSGRWIDLVGRFADRARRFGFGLVLTPMVEHSSAYCTIPSGSFGEMMTRSTGPAVRNESSAACAIAPV